MTAPPDIPALSLLGGTALRGIPIEAADALLAQTKVVALLAYLALSPSGVFQRRDRIAGLLWPELDQAHARTALRKAIHYARSVLGDPVIDGRGDEELALQPDALWVDVIDLRASIARGRLGRAIDLYRGELMPGFYLPECLDFDAWLSEQRTDLLEETVKACLELARILEAERGTEASDYARKAARLSTNERVLRRVLIMLDRLGDRAGAFRVYDEFAKRLRQELDVEPSRETQELVANMRAGRPAS